MMNASIFIFLCLLFRAGREGYRCGEATVVEIRIGCGVFFERMSLFLKNAVSLQ
jgi:hypothetical protein